MLTGQTADTKRTPRYSKVGYRSKISNDSTTLPNIDGRGVWPRRRRDVIKLLIAEITRRGRRVTPAQLLLVGQVASLQVRLEQMQGMICRGDAVDDEQMSRHGALVARLLDTLGLSSHQRVHEPDNACTPLSAHTRGDDESDANSSTKTTPTAV